MKLKLRGYINRQVSKAAEAALTALLKLLGMLIYLIRKLRFLTTSRLAYMDVGE